MGARVFVWLGGALFVASLAYCAWWYLVLLNRPLPAVRWDALAADAGLLTIFALHHSLFARDVVKARLARVLPDHRLRSAYVWVASLLLMAVCGLWRPVGGELYTAAGARAWAHAAVQLAGVFIIARAVARIDPLELAGIRPPSRAGALQVVGPYRLVRHPLYLGWLLTVFGAAHMTGDRLAFAAITTIYLIVAVPWEERSLRRSFGEDYAQYTRDVKWRIIPFIY
jgi:protein-S-isoprenylcysteine O-methyltransferase Ste14